VITFYKGYSPGDRPTDANNATNLLAKLKTEQSSRKISKTKTDTDFNLLFIYSVLFYGSVYYSHILWLFYRRGPCVYCVVIVTFLV